MVNPPNWFNLIQSSKNIVISRHGTQRRSSGDNPAKNTDGWDTYRSSNIVIQDSQIDNTDDCVSFKPNSTQVFVQNLQCTGSHGISVGSLGQYVGVVDWAIEVTGCYTVDADECAERPADFLIEDILFKDFDGTTSEKYGDAVATLSCSSETLCTNIRAENFSGGEYFGDK